MTGDSPGSDARAGEPIEPASGADVVVSAPAWDEGTARRRRLWFEVGAVLCIGVAMDLFSALWWLALSDGYGAPSDEGVYGHSYLIVRSLTVVVPVVYLIWVSGDGLERFGLLTRVRPVRDALWALALVAIGYAMWFVASWVYAWVYWVLPGTEESAYAYEEALAASGWAPAVSVSPLLLWTLLVLGIALNSVAEELVMRAYLLTRLEELLGSAAKAVVVGAVVFGAYHLYAGWYGGLSALLTGLVYGGFFVWRRRLWPLVIGHTAWNLLTYLWV